MAKPSKQHGRCATTIAPKPQVCYAKSAPVPGNLQEPQGPEQESQASSVGYARPPPVTACHWQLARVTRSEQAPQ
eukprot:7676663-Alexandrium_andersonii.AAC.1